MYMEVVRYQDRPERDDTLEETMKLYFIRHGATPGNRERRYVGRTDEGILESEIEKLRETGQSLPQPDGIFVSPYLRCLQSARALFGVEWVTMPDVRRESKELNSNVHSGESTEGIFSVKREIGIEIVKDLREMDFGAFEYKNYQELKDEPDYQKFIDSGGTVGFPGGEAPEAFKSRCLRAFLECIEKARKNRWEQAAFVVHGGTIMAILEALGEPKKNYYDYQVPNGCGYETRLSCQQEPFKLRLQIEKEIGNQNKEE